MPPLFPSPSISASNMVLYLANKNIVIDSTNSTTGLVTCLPISTNSTLTSEGLTILESDGITTSLSISAMGVLSTLGSISTTGAGSITSATSINSQSINVNGANFTVSSGGAVTAASTLAVTGITTLHNNLSIGSGFSVTSSSGALYTPGTIKAASDITVMDNLNTVAKITMGNDGHISAVGSITSGGDINVNSGKLVLNATSGSLTLRDGGLSSFGDVNVNSSNIVLSASSGNMSAKGSLTIGSTGQLVVNANGNLSTSGSLTSVGLTSTSDVNVGPSGVNNVVLAASSGNVTAKGSLTVGSAGQFVVGADGVLNSSKNININGPSSAVLALNSSDASIGTTYTGYVAPASGANTSYTNAAAALIADPNFFTSGTSTKLTTQSYVDKQIFNQTARLNLILGDETVSSAQETFSNVFAICQAIEGSSAAQSISNLTTQTSQVKVSVSTLIAATQNSYMMNAIPSVWKTNCPPMPIPSTLTGLPTPNYTGDGWFFCNSISGNQITWSIPVNSGITLGKLQQFYMNVFAASNVSLPQIVVKSSNSNYNNTLTYSFSASGSSSSANKSYCLYTTNSPLCYDSNIVSNGTGVPINTYGFAPNPSEISTSVSLAYSSVSANPSTSGAVSTGFSTYANSADVISSITIQSDASITAVNNIEFILQSLYIVQAGSNSGSALSYPSTDPIGTTQFIFPNTAVVQNFIMAQLFSRHSDLSVNPASGSVEGTYVNKYGATFTPAIV